MAKEVKAPDCCKGCFNWTKFGKKCFVYWDLKKHCTMYLDEGEQSALWDQSKAMREQGIR